MESPAGLELMQVPARIAVMSGSEETDSVWRVEEGELKMPELDALRLGTKVELLLPQPASSPLPQQ